MKRICLILALSLFSLTTFAQELDLDSARKQGLVVEQSDGYLKLVDAKAQELVNKINAARKLKFEEISKKTGAPVEEVAKQAAIKIQEGQGK